MGCEVIKNRILPTHYSLTGTRGSKNKTAHPGPSGPLGGVAHERWSFKAVSVWPPSPPCTPPSIPISCRRLPDVPEAAAGLRARGDGRGDPELFRSGGPSERTCLQCQRIQPDLCDCCRRKGTTKLGQKRPLTSFLL